MNGLKKECNLFVISCRDEPSENVFEESAIYHQNQICKWVCQWEIFVKKTKENTFSKTSKLVFHVKNVLHNLVNAFINKKNVLNRLEERILCCAAKITKSNSSFCTNENIRWFNVYYHTRGRLISNLRTIRTSYDELN